MASWDKVASFGALNIRHTDLANVPDGPSVCEHEHLPACRQLPCAHFITQDDIEATGAGPAVSDCSAVLSVGVLCRRISVIVLTGLVHGRQFPRSYEYLGSWRRP
jgi:hypothetical protein